MNRDFKAIVTVFLLFFGCCFLFKGILLKTSSNEPVVVSGSKRLANEIAILSERKQGENTTVTVSTATTPEDYSFEDLNNINVRLPDALIIGVKKSGTSAVKDFLRLHPDVQMPYDEIHFFDQHYDEGIDYYRSKLPTNVTSGQVMMEKTPAYFHDEFSANRIMATFGTKVKLIVVVRNPIDRMLSDYVHDQLLYRSLPSFQSLAFISNNRTGAKFVNTAFGPVIRSSYVIHLLRFLNIGFSLDNFLFIDGDNLAQNPGKELVKIEKFIGLKPMITESMFEYNQGKGFPCLKDPFTFADGSVHYGGFGSVKMPHICLDKDKGRPDEMKPNLTMAEREMFHHYFAPLNELFFDITGIKQLDWFK